MACLHPEFTYVHMSRIKKCFRLEIFDYEKKSFEDGKDE